MNVLRSLSVLLALAMVVASPRSVAAQQVGTAAVSRCGALTRTQLAAVDRAVQGAIDAGRVPGVSLGIAWRGTTCLRAYGRADLENAVPVTGESVFWVMSVNKEFTAASVMLLAERGLLGLDDPLSRYLPTYPWAQRVTIRQLLSHTSGIREFLAQPPERRAAIEARMRADPSRGVPELVDFIAAMSPDVFEFTPGTSWKYSNTNYVLLGAVIERVSGMSWPEFMRRNLFEPLGLRDTAVDNLLEVVPHRVRGYLRGPGGFRNAGDFPRNLAGPAGSLHSTARDLLAWQLALMGGRVVTQEHVRMMMSPARLGNGRPVGQEHVPNALDNGIAAYGLGFMLNDDAGRRTVGHIGNFPGFETTLQTYPDHGLTLAILTNRSGAATELAPQVARAILGPGPNSDASAIAGH